MALIFSPISHQESEQVFAFSKFNIVPLEAEIVFKFQLKKKKTAIYPKTAGLTEVRSFMHHLV